MKLFAAALTLLLPLGAATSATIYKSIDPDGHVTYSNIPQRGAQVIQLRLQGGDAPPPARPRAPRANALQAPPAGFPAVAPTTQKQRDDGRRQILQTELANEQRALDQARKALLDAEARGGKAGAEQQARLNGLRETIKDRERNVAALQRELGQ